MDVDSVRGWVERGVEHAGQRVKLKALRIGKWWKTSEVWVQEFIEALNKPGMPTQVKQSKGETSADLKRMQQALKG